MKKKRRIDERFLLRRVASWHLERKKNGRPLKINFPFQVILTIIQVKSMFLYLKLHLCSLLIILSREKKGKNRWKISSTSIVASWHLERKKNGRSLKINFPFPSYSNNNSGKKYVSLFKITPLFTSCYSSCRSSLNTLNVFLQYHHPVHGMRESLSQWRLAAVQATLRVIWFA